MLHNRLRIIQARAAQVNKVALEAEKAKYELHNQIQQIEEQLQPKRVRTDDDAGDADEILAEVDNWDLRDHRQQATRVQNRSNVQVGSRDNQQKSRTGKERTMTGKITSPILVAQNLEPHSPQMSCSWIT